VRRVKGEQNDVDGTEIASATYASNGAYVLSPISTPVEHFEGIHKAKEYIAANAKCRADLEPK
jgi:hypothetical protein